MARPARQAASRARTAIATPDRSRRESSRRGSSHSNDADMDAGDQHRDSTDESDEPEDDPSEDEDESFAPKRAGRRKSTTVATAATTPKNTGKRRKNTPSAPRSEATVDADQDQDQETEAEYGELYTAMISRAALKSTARDWHTRHHDDSDAAMLELLHFFLNCTGFPELQITSSEFRDAEEVPLIIKALEAQVAKTKKPDYPLIAKGKDFKKFESRMSELLDAVLQGGSPEAMVWDAEFIDVLDTWLTALASSKFRPFRHTATVLALRLHCTASSLIPKTNETEMNTARHLDAAETDALGATSVRSAKAKRVNDLREQVAHHRARAEHLVSTTRGVIDGVLVHRFRDTDPVIRDVCVRAVARVIEYVPSVYLADESIIRYLGWSLSDKHPLVRLTAIEALARLAANIVPESTVLSGFMERFAQRVAEIAARDVDARCRLAAIRVACWAVARGLMQDKSIRDVASAIADIDAKIRDEAASFIQAWIAATLASDDDEHDAAMRDESEQANEAIQLAAQLILEHAGLADALSVNIDNKSQILTAKSPEHDVIDIILRSTWHALEPFKNWKSLLQYIKMDSIVNGQDMTDLHETLLLRAMAISINGHMHGGFPLPGKRKVAALDDEDIENIASEIARNVFPSLADLLGRHAEDNVKLAAVLRIVLQFRSEIFSSFPRHQKTIVGELAKILKMMRAQDDVVLRLLSTAIVRASSSEGEENAAIADVLIALLNSLSAVDDMTSDEGSAAITLKTMINLVSALPPKALGSDMSAKLFAMASRISTFTEGNHDDSVQEAATLSLMLIHILALRARAKIDSPCPPLEDDIVFADQFHRQLLAVLDATAAAHAFSCQLIALLADSLWSLKAQPNAAEYMHRIVPLALPFQETLFRVFAEVAEQKAANTDAERAHSKTYLKLVADIARLFVLGAIELELLPRLLMHYGRNSADFDELVKWLLVHVSGKTGFLEACSRSLQESFEMDERSSGPMLKLADTLKSTLPPAASLPLPFFKMLISFCFGKVGGYQRINNTRSAEKSVVILRAVMLIADNISSYQKSELLGCIQSGVQENNVRIGANGEWEAYEQLLAKVTLDESSLLATT